MIIYKNGQACKFSLSTNFLHTGTNDLAKFPHSLWGVVKSVENLTPRGLINTLSTNEGQLEQHSLDSFLLSKRRYEAKSG